jgi:hypothetical protein
MTRPRATSWLALRILPAEKQQLREEARRHGITMSALLRRRHPHRHGHHQRRRLVSPLERENGHRGDAHHLGHRNRRRGTTGTDSHGVIADTHPPSRPTVRGLRKPTRARVTYRLFARDAVTPPRKLRFLCAHDSRRLRACKARYVVWIRRGPHVLRFAVRDEIGNTSSTVTVRVRRR